jgi:hypothetical protein
MVRRRDEIEPFISGVFDAYVFNMALEGIWGGALLLLLHDFCQGEPSAFGSQCGHLVCQGHIIKFASHYNS